MKVKKSIDLDGSGVSIIAMYERELLTSCERGSIQYNNCMTAFSDMLQGIANKAFWLGQENSK